MLLFLFLNFFIFQGYGKKTCQSPWTGQKGGLRCRNSEYMLIKSATYGRALNSGASCGAINPCDNSFDLSWQFMKSCNKKNYCNFRATDKMVGDPCPGKRKYTQIEYICKSS